jgi:hypothetical protein
LTLDPAGELSEAMGERSGIEPVVTVADDTALVSYRHPHQVITDIWVRRKQGWRLIASQVTGSF